MTDKRLPFTREVIGELQGLGCDVESLVAKYLERTKRKRIAESSAYLLQMGRDECAKAAGVTVDVVKDCSARRQVTRADALAVAAGAFSTPSEHSINRARRTRADAVTDTALRALSAKRFPSLAAAESAFTAEIANNSFRTREVGQ